MPCFGLPPIINCVFLSFWIYKRKFTIQLNAIGMPVGYGRNSELRRLSVWFEPLTRWDAEQWTGYFLSLSAFTSVAIRFNCASYYFNIVRNHFTPRYIPDRLVSSTIRSIRWTGAGEIHLNMLAFCNFWKVPDGLRHIFWWTDLPWFDWFKESLSKILSCFTQEIGQG